MAVLEAHHAASNRLGGMLIPCVDHGDTVDPDDEPSTFRDDSEINPFAALNCLTRRKNVLGVRQGFDCLQDILSVLFAANCALAFGTKLSLPPGAGDDEQSAALTVNLRLVTGKPALLSPACAQRDTGVGVCG